MNQLLDHARKGDKAAEEQLFQHLFVRFRLFAKHRVDDEEAAQDIAQEACITILEKYKTVTFNTGFEAGAYGVVKMKIGNHLQKKATRQKRVASQALLYDLKGTLPYSNDPEMKRRFIECLEKLKRANPQCARALNLFRLGYKTDDICDRMKVGRNNLYVILSRGRSMLKKCLETGEI